MRVSRIAAFFLTAGIACAAYAQVGHPVKGSWLGYWGPSEQSQHRLVLEMDWQDRQITGVINPGPKAVKVRRADIDYDDWTLTLEADLPNPAGKPTRWVATGKLENLGSWSNRRYTGTYQFGEERGKFHVTLH